MMQPKQFRGFIATGLPHTHPRETKSAAFSHKARKHNELIRCALRGVRSRPRVLLTLPSLQSYFTLNRIGVLSVGT